MRYFVLAVTLSIAVFLSFIMGNLDTTNLVIAGLTTVVIIGIIFFSGLRQFNESKNKVEEKKQ